MSRRRRTWIRGLLALLLGLALGNPAARAYRPPRYGGDAVAPLPSQPQTLDPTRMERLGEWQLATLLFDGLFRIANQGKAPELHLASHLLVVGAARRRVRITLRQGVRSHRGHRITSADVLGSLRRLQQSPNGWLLATVSRMRALGTHRLELQLARSCPELPMVLASPPALIVPRGLPPGRAPDGTGPFRFVRGRLTGPIRLSAYAWHFGGRPYIDSVTLVPYRRHRDEISAFYLGRSLISFQGKRLFGRPPSFATRQLRSPAVTTVALLVGARGAVADRRVRQAIYLAVNKRRLRQLVTGAPTRAAHGPVPPVLLGRRARWRARRPAPYDVARARRLLRAAQAQPTVAAARLPDGRLGMTLLVDKSRHRDMDAARKIRADLARVGIRLTISALPARGVQERRGSGRFELALHRFTSPVLRSRYHLAAAYAAAGRGRTARKVIRSLRRNLTRRIRTFMRELPLIPLFHEGLRAEVAARLHYLRQGPWGLPDWASAHFR